MLLVRVKTRLSLHSGTIPKPMLDASAQCRGPRERCVYILSSLHERARMFIFTIVVQAPWATKSTLCLLLLWSWRKWCGKTNKTCRGEMRRNGCDICTKTAPHVISLGNSQTPASMPRLKRLGERSSDICRSMVRDAHCTGTQATQTISSNFLLRPQVECKASGTSSQRGVIQEAWRSGVV